MVCKIKQVNLYTDGACKGNPGPGGYGAILEYNGKEKSFSGGYFRTTNNRMELMGVLKGLQSLKEPCNVTLTTDSKYVSDAITKGWASFWKSKGWKKADKKPALNSDLWSLILDLLDIHTVKTVWVQGHTGHPYNEKCDILAVTAAENPTSTDSGMPEIDA